MGQAANVAIGENAHAERADAATLRAHHELWFALARREWTSLVLVPADPDGSAAAIGRSLADIGTRLNEVPIRAISVSSMKYESAFALADLQQQIRRERHAVLDRTSAINVTGTVVATRAIEAAEDPIKGSDALALAPHARLVIAIPSVLTDRLGLAATQEADAVVLTIEMGRTRTADARRAIELIGRERITGCFLVR